MSWLAKCLGTARYETLLLRLFALSKIPLLFYVGLTIVEMSAERMIVRIPLNRRTRNHLGAMYFGALCIGADVAPGAYAIALIRKSGLPIAMVFKDFQAEFLKRAEGDVHFICNQGKEVAALVEQAAASGDRVEKQFEVIAVVPAKSAEPVAKFKLTLSLKRRT